MAIGRISGPLLAPNLLRDGIDLAFETDLLYLDVTNGRIGIRQGTPLYELDVNGTINAKNLRVVYTGTGTGQAIIGNLVLSSGTIASSTGSITISPASGQPTIVSSDLSVSGSAVVTGNLTSLANTILGNNLNVDETIFNSRISSDFVPSIDQQYNIGSTSLAWLNVFTKSLVAGNIVASSATQSNSISEGSLVVNGGAGIAKNLYVGQDLHVEGNTYLNPNGFDVSIQPTSGGTAVIYPDNTGSINNMTIGLTESAAANFTTVKIINTSNSTNSTSGSLVVSGGVGIAKDLNVGGNIFANGQLLGGLWYYTSTNYLASAGDRLLLDTSTASIVVTLPALPVFGNIIEFIDYSATFASNNMTFARNGQRIMGLDEDLIVNVNYAANSLVYSGIDQGWKIGVIL
jgi:hypothetical protein